MTIVAPMFRKCSKIEIRRLTTPSSRIEAPPLSFAMSCSGWLLPFHLGVIERLKSSGHMNDSTVYSGSSGGSIAAVVACANIPPREALEIIMTFAKDKEFKKNIDIGMKKCLTTMCPPDILQRVDGRLHIAVTKAWPNPELKSTIVSHFNSSQDLIDTVAASCFIPLYSGSMLQLFTKLNFLHSNAINNQAHETNRYLDGGVFAIMPPICKVRVTPIPPSGHFICGRRVPHIFPLEDDFRVRDLLVWALNPPDGVKIEKMFQKGIEAADRWLVNQPVQ